MTGSSLDGLVHRAVQGPKCKVRATATKVPGLKDVMYSGMYVGTGSGTLFQHNPHAVPTHALLCDPYTDRTTFMTTFGLAHGELIARRAGSKLNKFERGLMLSPSLLTLGALDGQGVVQRA